MLLIPCPYCGERSESEFHYGGEAHIARPRDPAKANDEDWADYLFFRKNTKGVTFERWLHAQGCRRWFNVARHTVTYEVLAAYEMGAPPPMLDSQSEI